MTRWFAVLASDGLRPLNGSCSEGNGSIIEFFSHYYNWYKNSRGRVTQNSPWSMADYWHMTKEVNPDDCDFPKS